MLKVKRPYMRSVPCAVECRADGKSVYALIGDSTSALTDGERGIIAFGDTLPDALRALADAIEKEVEVTGEEDEQLPNQSRTSTASGTQAQETHI